MGQMKELLGKLMLYASAGLILASCSRAPTSAPQPGSSSASGEDQSGILFQDDFSDPSSGWQSTWFEGSGGAHAEGYQDGAYRIWVDNNQNKYAISLATPGLSFDDISLEVDVRRSTGDEGGTAYLMCRVNRDTTSFYYFALDGLNNASIGFYLNGEEQHVIWNAVPSEILRTDSNRLRGDCIGSKLTVYVNGQLITEAEETDLKMGDVGLGAGGASQGMTEIFFDGFLVLQANREGLAAGSEGELSAGESESGILIASEDMPPPPPSGYVKSIEAGVAAGLWTYEEGLIEALQVLTGEAPSLSLPQDLQPQGTEGTGVVRLAQDYLASGKNDGTKLELQRLIGQLIPEIDNLQLYSTPEPQAQAKVPGCADLWKAGFPPNTASLCFLYAQQMAKAGTLVRVYYPADWAPGDPRRDYSPLALNAAVKALDSYGALGSVGISVNIVFTVLPAAKPLTLAATQDATAGKSCLVVVYPKAISMDQGSSGQSTPNGNFQQTVAHELAHCFQGWNIYPSGWNFPKQGWNWYVNQWWGEGSAEYLSNLVYPDANYEWRWINNFDSMSGFTSTLGMDYENFIFFQELANRDGADGVIEFLKQMPVASLLPAQATVLAGYKDIDGFYQHFIQDYLDQTITDTSGVKIPAQPSYQLSEQKNITNTSQLQLTSPPFTLKKYLLTFWKGTLYEVKSTESGASGQVAAKPLPGSTGWSFIPTQVPASCKDLIMQVGLTTAVPGVGPLVDDLAIVGDQKIGCDPCLVGTWDLDLPAFEDYLRAPFVDLDPGFFQVDMLGGLWRLHFSDQAEARGEYDFLVTYEIDQSGEDSTLNITTQVGLDLNGDGTAQYHVDENNGITFYEIEDDLAMKQTVFINGQEVPGGDNLFSGFPVSSGISGTAKYACDPVNGVLVLMNDLGNGKQAPPVKYNRISINP
jgi:hypothetical protein